MIYDLQFTILKLPTSNFQLQFIQTEYKFYLLLLIRTKIGSVSVGAFINGDF
jgi:hypothetical protein